MSELKMSQNLTCLKNIQNFLNKFKKGSRKIDVDESHSVIINQESQLPDLYLKTRTPIDRNKMFFKTDDKKKACSKSKTYLKKQESNLFPM